MEIKTNYDGVAISAKPITLTVNNVNIDKKWYENFENSVLRICEKETPMIEMIEKKEGNKMIENVNLVDLIFKGKEEKIVKESDKKIIKIREKNKTISKLEEIIERAEKEINELFLSQLTEEDLQKVKEGKFIEYNKYPLVIDSDLFVDFEGGYRNYEFMNEEIKEILVDKSTKIDELRELKKQVQAHIAIAKTKEETEEILRAYGLLDKKGKLVIK